MSSFVETFPPDVIESNAEAARADAAGLRAMRADVEEITRALRQAFTGGDMAGVRPEVFSRTAFATVADNQLQALLGEVGAVRSALESGADLYTSAAQLQGVESMVVTLQGQFYDLKYAVQLLRDADAALVYDIETQHARTEWLENPAARFNADPVQLILAAKTLTGVAEIASYGAGTPPLPEIGWVERRLELVAAELDDRWPGSMAGWRSSGEAILDFADANGELFGPEPASVQQRLEALVDRRAPLVASSARRLAGSAQDLPGHRALQADALADRLPREPVVAVEVMAAAAAPAAQGDELAEAAVRWAAPILGRDADQVLAALRAAATEARPAVAVAAAFRTTAKPAPPAARRPSASEPAGFDATSTWKDSVATAPGTEARRAR